MLLKVRRQSSYRVLEPLEPLVLLAPLVLFEPDEPLALFEPPVLLEPLVPLLFEPVLLPLLSELPEPLRLPVPLVLPVLPLPLVPRELPVLLELPGLGVPEPPVLPTLAPGVPSLRPEVPVRLAPESELPLPPVVSPVRPWPFWVLPVESLRSGFRLDL